MTRLIYYQIFLKLSMTFFKNCKYFCITIQNGADFGLNMQQFILKDVFSRHDVDCGFYSKCISDLLRAVRHPEQCVPGSVER